MNDNGLTKAMGMILAGFIVGVIAGVAVGSRIGDRETTTKLTHEAVREKAGMWVANDDGSARFVWSVCVPAKPQEVQKK